MSLEALRLAYSESPTSMVISAKSGESHKVKEIWIDSPADKSYMDITIGTKGVMRIPIAWNDALFVAPYNGSIYNESIISMIKKILGADFDIEADEDEDITLDFSSAPGAVYILYEVGKSGIDKSKLGRSNSETIPLFHILTHSSAVNATGSYSLDTVLMPTGFPDLKDGSVIPSGRIFSLKALGFGSVASGSTIPTFLHLYDETFEFFDPINHTGIPVKPSHNFLKVDVNTMDIYTVPQHDYLAGHKLTAEFDASFDGTNSIAAETLALFLIGLWKPSR